MTVEEYRKRLADKLLGAQQIEIQTEDDDDEK
jgi:hypothetical protein